MKLDTRTFRYLSEDDWRVLTAVELGTRNHTLVPTSLIISLSSLRTGASGVTHSISTLAKANLIAKIKNAKYDGYRLTYGGLDYLAMHALVKSNAVVALGSQLGVGKESDVYFVQAEMERSSLTPATDRGKGTEQCVLKLHRLGRTSFRSLKNLRAYHGNRSHCSWQHLSQLSARKEHAAMQALRNAGMPVPRPISHNRHTVVMSLVPGVPLRQLPLSAFGPEGSKKREDNVARLYGECIELALRLAELGVIHGDFNEFNILVENVPDPEEDSLETDHRKPMIPHIIDFPQITSLSHPSASAYFTRDIECINRFFRKRYLFSPSTPGPTIDDALSRLRRGKLSGKRRVDVEIEAMGFSRKMAKELDAFFEAEWAEGEEHDSATTSQLEEEQGDGQVVSDGDDSTLDVDPQPPTEMLSEGEELNMRNATAAFQALVVGEETGNVAGAVSAEASKNGQVEKKSFGRTQDAKAAAGWSI